jgi:RPA family protein
MAVSTRVSTIYIFDFSNQLNSEMCVLQEYRVKGNGVVSQHPGQCEEGDMLRLEIDIHPWDGTGVVVVYLEDEDRPIVHIEIDSVQELIRFMQMSQGGQVQAVEASSRQYESSKVTGFTILVEILPD